MAFRDAHDALGDDATATLETMGTGGDHCEGHSGEAGVRVGEVGAQVELVAVPADPWVPDEIGGVAGLAGDVAEV